MTGFNTQVCEAEKSYRLQFETDNKEHFLFMQEAARSCVDGVRPGVRLEPMVVENPDWQLYTEYRGDKPYAYRYGPEWVAMQLAMEGGYKTPEEAKLRWLEEWEKMVDRD